MINARHKSIKAFYEHRERLKGQNVTNEMGVREAFKTMLAEAARLYSLELVVEQTLRTEKGNIRPDGILRDDIRRDRGYWESKDTRDDLQAEIQKKFAAGYSNQNTIFEDTRRAILYQHGDCVGEFDLDKPDDVARLLHQFFSYTEPVIEKFDHAVEKFREEAPNLARSLQEIIEKAHKENKAFKTAFADFYELCKQALNPNISPAAVNEMLIQHLLTERLMRTVFDNPDFARRNAIAAEVEKVIDALTSQSFSRSQFLSKLDFFYEAIESTARTIYDFTTKQKFINTVYERFFQGYSVKVADTHGIVYTPQEIVDFMCAAVEETLDKEFGKALWDDDVYIIDPATGTGNFIVNLLRRIHQRRPDKLPDVYRERLFANEVMLLPYYVASLNIEHEFLSLTNTYAPFEGLCFVDTLDLAEGKQMAFSFMTEKNSERVERQKKAPITVIIGNPPYNVGQLNENDNNKNRAYPVIDKRVRDTYVKDSRASNRNALYDAYVKFFRWASDRLQGRDGIVCYVSNNSFVDQLAFDGMRKHLLEDFTSVYHLDLHGNVRQNPKLSGTTHNVFGIQVGVGITVAIRSSKHDNRKLFYKRVPEFATKNEKLAYMTLNVELDGRYNALNTIEWTQLVPDKRYTWRIAENTDEFATFIPIGSKETKKAKGQDAEVIFKIYGRGVATTRDETVYDFDRDKLIEEIQAFIENYNSEVDRYKRTGKPKDVDNFVKYDLLKWSRDLKLDLVRGNYAQFSETKVRICHYRPFCKKHLFFDRILNEEVYVFPRFFPTTISESENRILWLKVGGSWPVFPLMSNTIVDLLPEGGSQCFPFYVYDEDGSNRRENITDWALNQFQTHYNDPAITKWDIFYYVYAILHHPDYRERYKDNLKRDLPRIPFAPQFRSFADAGKRLADLHLNYETLAPYPLEQAWKPGKPVSWRVEKMRLGRDKTLLAVNESLTLNGIPPAAFEYRLGNRSALDWVIDQYQVKKDERSGIVSDPNRYSDDEKYIVNLVGRVTRVSVETVEIVKGLPGLA